MNASGNSDPVPASGCRRCEPGRLSRLVGRLLETPVRIYRVALSPLLAPRCRFLPSCSEYALQALATHGPVRGSWLAVRRFVRCHPWGASGIDEVPAIRCACGAFRFRLNPDHQRTASSSTPATS